MTKKTIWFSRKGIIFFPVSKAGWLLAAAALIYCIYSFITIDSRSHSASDTLRNFFFIALIVFAVYSLIAYFTSRRT